jgi:hypothetical protein
MLAKVMYVPCLTSKPFFSCVLPRMRQFCGQEGKIS